MTESNCRLRLSKAVLKHSANPAFVLKYIHNIVYSEETMGSPLEDPILYCRVVVTIRIRRAPGPCHSGVIFVVSFSNSSKYSTVTVLNGLFLLISLHTLRQIAVYQSQSYRVLLPTYKHSLDYGRENRHKLSSFYLQSTNSHDVCSSGGFLITNLYTLSP